MLQKIAVEVNNLKKVFKDKLQKEMHALCGVTLAVKEGNAFVLLGPSGCGKSTLLRCCAGLEQPSDGEIKIDDKIVVSISRNLFIPPEKRNISMVFQSYAIWPHMSVFDNVALPLKMKKGVKKEEIKPRVIQALEMVEMVGYENRSATKLSGGQQQRVALARALVSNQRIILLDEPLSNLDAKLRERMRHELKRLQRDLGLTMFYVTHDQVEALALADEIAVMKDGVILQQGRPREVYERPNSAFVADFLGRTNFLSGTIVEIGEGESCTVSTAIGKLRGKIIDKKSKKREVLISIRPEHISISDRAMNTENCFCGEVIQKEFLGDHSEWRVRIGESDLLVSVDPDMRAGRKQQLNLIIDPDKCIVLERPE